jgi:type IV secretory pathway VirJ component
MVSTRDAGVMTAMAARLPDDLRSRIELIALLGPSRRAAFEFHLSDWMKCSGGIKQYPMASEVKSWTACASCAFTGIREMTRPAGICRPLG